MPKCQCSDHRRYFIGGSDARIIMGNDEAALIRLWREKRGEDEPEDLSGNLVVQLGVATEELNRRWYRANSGQVLTDVQRRIRHPVLRWMAATLDGRVEATGAVFEAKFMLPWSFSEEAAAEKYMPQLQHNMWVVAAAKRCPLSDHRRRQMGRDHHPRRSALSASDCHRRTQVLALCRERRAAAAVRGRATKPRLQAVRIVDMSASNAWAEFAGLFREPGTPSSSTSRPEPSSRALMPEDAKEAIGHGIRAKRSKSGAVSFGLFETWRRAMQRSSPSIAAIATALAKAQIELSNPEKSLIGMIEPQNGEGGVHGNSAMRRCRAGSTSCARPWVSMRSPPCRLPRLIRPPALSISQPYWLIRRGNGSPRTGRSARSLRRQCRTGWALL